MTPEEIKKIAQSYGESVANSFDYDMFANPDFKHKLKVKGEANKAERVLEWLLMDYCIIPKSKVKEYYEDVCEDIRDYNGKGVFGVGCADMTMYQRARGMKQMLFRLFGKDTFEDSEK